jgi:hypothetical protein
MTLRERLAALLYTIGPGPANAAFVLSGDGTMRLDAALGLVRMGLAPVVAVAGGLDDPPHSLSARDMRFRLITGGLTADRIVEVTPGGLHTRAETDIMCQLAEERGWEVVNLITSAYHLPRAFLSAIASLQKYGLLETLQVRPICVNPSWWGTPEGREMTRIDLWTDERAKTSQYQAKGDVASYKAGLAYLDDWWGL